MSEVISVVSRNGAFQKTMIMEEFSSDESEDDYNMTGSEDEEEGEEGAEKSKSKSASKKSSKNIDSELMTPGELITSDPIWMRGHGTYFLENDTYSSVAGRVSKVNKLLSVIPLKSRYAPETGDHVVGRIAEVSNKRWKVDIGGKQHAILMLGSVNLPGGILRRKSESDELQMRSFLKEGDLLNAEVQSLFQDGAASLHTRSLKYGKLRNGQFCQVPNSLIVRSKNHTHNLPGNVTVVLGVNGYIWLRMTSSMDLARDAPPGGSTQVSGGEANGRASGPTGAVSLNPNANLSITRLEEESSWKIYSDENDASITNQLKQTISRYANIIKALAFCEVGITHERIVLGYEASLAYSDVGALIQRDNMEALGADVLNAERMRGNAE